MKVKHKGWKLEKLQELFEEGWEVSYIYISSIAAKISLPSHSSKTLNIKHFTQLVKPKMENYWKIG